MTRSNQNPAGDADFEDLLARLCDGTIDPEGLRRLGDRVAGDAAARRLYLEYLDLHAALGGMGLPAALPDLGPAETLPFADRAARRFPRIRRWALGGAAAAAVLIASTSYWLGRPPTATHRGSESGELARVVEVTGQTELWNAAGESVRATAGSALRPGETLRTDSPDAFATLEFPGGTRVELSPQGQLHLADADGPTRGLRLLLSTGVLHADVKSGPDARPLTIRTPQVEVRAEGASLLIAAVQPNVTEVETESGPVRLTRLADGRSIEIPPSSTVSASSEIEALEVRPLPEFALAPRITINAAGPLGLAFSSDATRLLTVSKERASWWDVKSGQLLPPDHKFSRHYRSIVLAGDGATIAADDYENRIYLIDTTTGQERRVLNLDEVRRKHLTLAVARNGSRVAAAHALSGPGTTRVWDASNGHVFPRIPDPAPPVRGLALSADGRRLAAATPPNRKRPNPRLFVWAVDTGTRLAAINAPERSLSVLLFSPDARRLAGATDDGALFIWDVASGKSLNGRSAADGWTWPIKSLAFSPDGRLLAAGTSNGHIHVWDTAADRDVGLLSCGTGNKRQVDALAFSPDGRTLAASTPRKPVTLWDVPALGPKR